MKKNVKKVIALLLALVLCTAMLVGCAGDKEDKTDEGKNNTSDVTDEGKNNTENVTDEGKNNTSNETAKGETYDAGNVSVLVPDGWKAFPVTDVFEEYDGEYDPTAVQVCKGGEEEWDIFTKPYMQINYYPDNSMYVSSDWYDNVVELEPMQIGGYTWNGFTGTSLDYPMAVLYTDGDVQIQVSITLENTDGKISLDDADVQAIIASIQVK